MSETDLDAARLWAEYVDPQVPGQRFRVDVTWLTATHRCVFGTGCPGIDRNRPHDGCCTLGAEFADAEDLTRVSAAVERLDGSTWQLRDAGLAHGWHEPVPPDQADAATASDTLSTTTGATPADTTDATNHGIHADRRTTRLEGACVFLNRPGFPGGPGCALHRLALDEGVPPMRYKPDVCWQLPIRRTYRQVTLPDETTYLEVSIGEFDRRGWGPGGLDLDWYCTGSPIAHGHDEPVYRSCAAELRELMGEGAYQQAVRHCESLLAAAAALARHPVGQDAMPELTRLTHLTHLVHPASLAAEGLP